MREIPDIKNTVFISSTISSEMSIEDSFQFIIGKLGSYYNELSEGHEYFKIVNGDRLEVGSKIECSERAGNQSILHDYIVHEIIQNDRIHYSSKPSLVKVTFPWATINSKSNTYVYYDFAEKEDGTTSIRLTIGIQFKNVFEKLFSHMFLGILPWKKHCLEEMKGLKQILDKSAGSTKENELPRRKQRGIDRK